MKKKIFFLVLVLGGLKGLQRIVPLQLLQHSGWGMTWNTVMLNGLPWKRMEIILSF